MAGLLLLNLNYPLLKPDEYRYAEIGREMLASGDWLVPRLNREPYLDKPPLYYWLTSISYWLFGFTEWAARLVPACAAFLTILATYVFGNRILGGRCGFLAALALALTTGFLQCGRFIVLYSVFTLFITLALFTATRQRQNRANAVRQVFVGERPSPRSHLIQHSFALFHFWLPEWCDAGTARLARPVPVCLTAVRRATLFPVMSKGPENASR